MQRNGDRPKMGGSKEFELVSNRSFFEGSRSKNAKS
jgi:hypothetical protein